MRLQIMAYPTRVKSFPDMEKGARPVPRAL